MISTIMECLQGIQLAKEAAVPDKNGSGNLANKYKYFTRANDVYMRYNMYLNTLWIQYY
jgi:hypothetical protein